MVVQVGRQPAGEPEQQQPPLTAQSRPEADRRELERRAARRPCASGARASGAGPDRPELAADEQVDGEDGPVECGDPRAREQSRLGDAVLREDVRATEGLEAALRR